MSGASSFKIQVGVPKRVLVEGRALEREDFFSWIWSEYSERGLQGVHEGTLLSTEAAEQGFETDSWTLDAAEAPRERDWVSSQSIEKAELYFESLETALAARDELRAIAGVEVGEPVEQKQEDWDAQWKASFLNAADGVPVPPFWRILPPWVTGEEAKLQKTEVPLRINPGAGFGTGTHETTQLCLRAIGESAQLRSLKGARVLDFGSGSGILAIGAALLGARVDAVEIDPLAIDNARENARINQVESRIEYALRLEELQDPPVAYQMVIANILRPVLLQFAEELVKRMDSRATLVLSGLIEKDTAEVSRRYSELLGFAPETRFLNEWWSLVWKRKGD